MNSPLDATRVPSTADVFHAPARTLLGPGPSMVDPRVLSAMSSPMVGHLDPFFLGLMDQNQELLRQVFRTANSLTLPVSGTGSAAMESAIANMVQAGDPVLVCINGYFGSRMAEMARRYGGRVREIHCPWGSVFKVSEIKQALREQPARIVCIVHAETSTGALQPVDEIARLVHQQGGIIIVDAVTSFGGIPLNVDEWDLDVVYSATQKCISCPPGLGPITFGPRADEILRTRHNPVSNWYLDITLLRKYWSEERVYHHTAPINLNYGLHEALQLVVQEGLEQRFARHKSNAQMLWDGLQELGLTCHVPLENRLPTLTTVVIPEGVDEALVRRRLLYEYNIEIAAGLGELKGKVWRVGLMGYSSRQENVILFLDALSKIIRSS